MGNPITTRPGAKWTNEIKPEVTKGETCKFNVVLSASEDIDWTGTTAYAQIRTEGFDLVHAFPSTAATIDSDGAGNVILQATAAETANWTPGKHFCGVRVVSPNAGTIDMPNFFLVVHNGAVQ